MSIGGIHSVGLASSVGHVLNVGSSDVDEDPRLQLVRDLDTALHGVTWARPASPLVTWESLIQEVRELVEQGGRPATIEDLGLVEETAERCFTCGDPSYQHGTRNHAHPYKPGITRRLVGSWNRVEPIPSGVTAEEESG